MFDPVEEQYKYCPRCGNVLEKRKVESKERLHCKKCGFIFWKNPKPCVSIILHKDGKVLMLKRAKEPFKDYWVLPGGYLEYNETPEKAILREAKEETGLGIKLEGLLGVYLIDNDPQGNSLDVIYYETIPNGQIKLKEHSEYQFFAPNNLPKNIAYKHREAILDWRKK